MDSIGYLGIFVALLGLGGALWAGLAHVRARGQVEAAKRWLDVPGKVLSTNVEQRGSMGSGRNSRYYVPQIRYSYVVNGRERQGSRLRFGLPSARTRGGAEQMLAAWPVGGAIKVRYDPDDPDQSVLEPGKAGGKLLLASIACAILFLIGAGIVVLAVRGVFSADVSGHWHVRFEAEGVVYEGDLEAQRGAGPLTLAFTSQGARSRVREDCTLTRNRQNVLVRCANPQLIEGSGNYSADNFNLSYQGASRLTGSVTSNGAAVGTATFTR